jgi:UV DNA damage endonuclease
MPVNIGFACLGDGIKNVRFKTCRVESVSDQLLIELIDHNLTVLDRFLDYLIVNDLHLFRVSSDLIPLASHPVNQVLWWELFSDRLKALGIKAKTHSIRLTMHPGQYTVLNSPVSKVVEQSIKDLQYHARLLNTMQLDNSSKMVLHLGGVYGDKQQALKRFAEVFNTLETGIKNRLIIENDDRHYTIGEVYAMGMQLDIPVVFDNLHHELNPDLQYSELEWINLCAKTWTVADGQQKIHYSQPAIGKRPGSHSTTIDLALFRLFYDSIKGMDLDVMLEVKDKNLSAIKCHHLIHHNQLKYLDMEWTVYKYLILEHSIHCYQKIRELLKDKSAYPIVEFYQLIDQALDTPVTNNYVNAYEHVWGHLKDLVSDQEKERFFKLLRLSSTESRMVVKRYLWRLVMKYQERYLINSYFFKEVYNKSNDELKPSKYDILYNDKEIEGMYEDQ